MEERVNIAEILKDKPQGTKLYDLLRNIDVELDKAHTTDVGTYIECTSTNEVGSTLLFDYSKLGTEESWLDGLQILLPSKEMRDWRKFAWKRGDVLISDCGFVCIFKEWASDDYTKFNGCYFDGMPNAETAKYSKLDNNTAYGYIRELENICGGKLNLETLKIEKQTEFKDGDVVVTDAVPSLYYSKCIFILKGDLNTDDSCANSYIFYNINNNDFCFDVLDTEIRDRNIHLATDSEKQQLFDALEKVGKVWVAEKKQIVDLKPKCEFKPFDKVLCRNSKDDTWEADFFARLTRKEIDYTQSGKYLCVGDLWMYCIPYNEETAHLLGTTDEWKGGEG